MENNIEQQKGQVAGKRSKKNSNKKSKILVILLSVFVFIMVVDNYYIYNDSKISVK